MASGTAQPSIYIYLDMAKKEIFQLSAGGKPETFVVLHPGVLVGEKSCPETPGSFNHCTKADISFKGDLRVLRSLKNRQSGCGGGGEIRTRGPRSGRRFSRPVVSTAHPPLR